MLAVSAFTFASPSERVGDVAQCIDLKTGTTSPCGPGNQVCPPGLFDNSSTPQFHVKDASCALNDPNGPSYDPVHGVYHIHYQNHVGLNGGRTYGHAVSKDLIHWAHMPVSIWNDQPYDASAIWTGSATIVDGKVVQVYPGLCNTHEKDCPGSLNLCIASPADPTDQLQTNWSKDAQRTGAVNPVINEAGRDPSTAWKIETTGEWQMTDCDSTIYGSMDFKTWYTIGKQPGFPVFGECPSFFPLPPTTPGAGSAPAGAPTYTHVHKGSHSGDCGAQCDWMQVGVYTPPRSTHTLGNWTAEPEVNIDKGRFYASKDFWDPVKERRINWGWAMADAIGTQSLPRMVTWNPELQQLVHSPLEEQDQLRGSKIVDVHNVSLIANSLIPLQTPPGAGKQAEVEVTFALPSTAARLGVVVMASDAAITNGSLFYIDYVPPTVEQIGAPYTVTVGAQPMARKGASDTGHRGGLPWGRSARHRELSAADGVTGDEVTDALKLSPSDTSLTIRVYVDHTFSEAYWMGGRVAMTISTPSTSEAGMAAFASAPATLESAQAYAVDSIWVTKEQVRAAPRKDGKPIVGW